MNILGTGLSGLVGSRVVELLNPQYIFENLSLETGVDITQKESLDTYMAQSDAAWVFHMAAYTDVQKAEIEQEFAWKINVEATEHIVENCKKFNKKLLYVDTDYAFDGTKKEYREDDTPNPLGWYGKTKSEGAKRVLVGGGLVIRISNPYRANPVGKKDFVHKMLEKLQAGEAISAATDQLFTPTFIDDIAGALQVLVRDNASGIYHIVSNPAITPFEAGTIIAQEYGFDTALVLPATFQEMFAGRVPVPQYAYLRNDKISAKGVRMHTFRQSIALIKKQENVIK